MTIVLPSAFAHSLRTCEGYVSTNADTYTDTKTKLCQRANAIFGNKVGYKYWTGDANTAVIQLDGNYFVVDTDDEESDSFVMDIMAKYGILDNFTPSLSNCLLGMKNKNHYWFILPANMRWSCKINYVKGNYDATLRKKHSKLDLLGSKNRIIFENIKCLDNLKDIPMLTLEILNDLKDYIPMALIGTSCDIIFPVAAPAEQCLSTQALKQLTQQEPKNARGGTCRLHGTYNLDCWYDCEECLNNNDDSNFVLAPAQMIGNSEADYSLPEWVRDYIDTTFTPEDSIEQDRFFFNGAHLLRKYGDEENGLGWNAVHYFAKLAGPEIYNCAKVTKWLKGTKVEKMTATYGILKPKGGQCLIKIEEEDEAALSQASTNTGGGAAVESPCSMIIGADEDRNFTTICDKIVPDIRKVLVYCREEWYFHDETTHLWSAIKEPQKIIKKYMFKCVAENNKNVAIRLASLAINDKSTRDELIALQKEFLSLYSKIESLQNITLVKRDLMISLCDNEFVNKLDNTTGQLVFKDGIYDIATDTFRKGLKYEDNLSYTLPYNYQKATEKNIADVKKEIFKICANEAWRFDYYMEILGYAMLGMPADEQVAFFMVGMTAGNGKSTLLEALTEMMPNYVVKLNSKTFSKGNADFKKNINSIKGARVAWINEVEKKPQDIDTIKDIADGKTIKNPVLFKQTEELIQIMAKLFFVSNGEIGFASDEGIKRRYRYVQFIAQFYPKQDYDRLVVKRRDIDFVKDTAFAELLVTQEGFFALLELILDGARRWLKTKSLIVPDQYKQLAIDACDKNEEFGEFVATNIVKDVGKIVSWFEIEERYKLKNPNTKLGKEDKKTFRDYMATKGINYDCKKKKRVDGHIHPKDGCFMNCKLTTLEEATAEAIEDSTEEE